MQEVMARESSAWAELADLMADPIYWAPPRTGDGGAVLVLPGLFANDLYLGPMRNWLGRSGYRPVRSALWMNAGCPERLTRRTEEHLARRVSSPNDEVAIIGHSGGGFLGRAIAARLQERASHLILLGSPVGGITRWATVRGMRRGTAARAVGEAGERARRVIDPDCNVPDCGCPFPEDFLRPLHPDTRVTSIYSPNDPIVPAAGCPVPGGRNIEVTGTHSGLAFNKRVYRELAEALRD